MKWKIPITFLLFGCAVFLWFHGEENKAAAFTAREIAVAGAEKQEILRLAGELVRLYNEKGASSLERIFVQNRAKRRMIQTETGSDPVRESLNVLQRNGPRLTLRDPEVKSLSNARHRYLIDCRLRPEGPAVRISMQKTPNGYGLNEIREH